MTIASYSQQQVQPQLSQSRPSPARYSNARSRFRHVHQKQTCFVCLQRIIIYPPLRHTVTHQNATQTFGASSRLRVNWCVHMNPIQGARGALQLLFSRAMLSVFAQFSRSSYNPYPFRSVKICHSKECVRLGSFNQNRQVVMCPGRGIGL